MVDGEEMTASDEVKAAIAAFQQATTLKNAAIAKLLEQRAQIDVDLKALGYTPAQPENISAAPSNLTVMGSQQVAESLLTVYTGPATFKAVSTELKRRATLLVRETGCLYATSGIMWN